MKKKMIIGVAFVLLVAAIIFALLPRVSINPEAGGTVNFHYGGSNIYAVLESEETIAITDILNGKRIHSSIYLNGFTEDISFSIDELTFCPARDMSPILYVWEKDRYISLSNEEMNTIRTILTSYGFTFPCP